MSKKRKNPFMVQILKNLELRSRQTSKKRKRPDDIHESKHNLDAPPTKKMKFEKHSRIKTQFGRATDQKIHESKHNLDAPPTKKMKFEKPLNRKQIVNELKNHHAYKGRSSWNKTDLTQYLEYLNSNPNALGNLNLNHNVNDKTEISKDEFIKIPLFKLQSIYNFGTGETNRDGMYRTMQKEWKSERERQRERQHEVDKLLEPIISKFFIVKTDGKLCIKSHVNADTDKVLVFHDLDSNNSSAIRQFANQNKLLFSTVHDYHFSISGVGLMCDQSQVMDVLREEENKRRDEEMIKQAALQAKNDEEEMRRQDALRAKEDEEWKKMIEKYALLREGKNEAHHMVFGEWIIKEDFGYGDKDEYYLYFNKQNTDVYGSFLIGPIKGQLKVQRPAGFSYLNRKLHFDWRGRETGENVLQGGNETGEIVFSEYGTLAEGILHSDYGDFEFHALKISDDVMVNASESDFDYDVEEMYEQERVSRWGTKKYSCERARRTGGI
eukprot:217149_1